MGIPTSKPPRKIKNVDESKWEEGYDSDGEIGPFLDAVAGETTRGVEEEDEGFVPASMVRDGAAEAPEEAVASGGKRKRRTKAKSRKKKTSERKKASVDGEDDADGGEMEEGDEIEASYLYLNGQRTWEPAKITAVKSDGTFEVA